MKLSEKIVKHRKINGWSQEDLAERINVSRQAISRWEGGTAQPDATNILQLSKLFGVTTDYLLGDDETEPPPSAAPAAAPPQQDWLERLPGFLGRLLRRFGWLSGVYLAVLGGSMTGFGVVARVMVSAMFSAFDTRFDTAGVFYGSAFDAYRQQVGAMAQNNPVTMFGTVLIVTGLLFVAGGIALAIFLKRKFRTEA